MCRGILIVNDYVSVFAPKFWIKQRNGVVDGETMAVIVCDVMGEGAEREGVLVEISGIANQSPDEISATHIVSEIAEELVSEGIVAHVLNDGAAIGVCVGLFQLVRSRVRELLQEQRFNDGVPFAVNNRLMTEDGETLRALDNKYEEENENRCGLEPPPQGRRAARHLGGKIRVSLGLLWITSAASSQHRNL